MLNRSGDSNRNAFTTVIELASEPYTTAFIKSDLTFVTVKFSKVNFIKILNKNKIEKVITKLIMRYGNKNILFPKKYSKEKLSSTNKTSAENVA
jgi:hypothetical protein